MDPTSHGKDDVVACFNSRIPGRVAAANDDHGLALQVVGFGIKVLGMKDPSAELVTAWYNGDVRVTVMADTQHDTVKQASLCDTGLALADRHGPTTTLTHDPKDHGLKLNMLSYVKVVCILVQVFENKVTRQEGGPV